MNIFVTCVMLLATLAPHSSAYADPNIQSVNQAQNPYRSFSGYLTSSSQLDLLTLPSDQVFIVTTCITNVSYMHIRQDSTIKLHRLTYACQKDHGTSFTQGKAHLVIDSGTVMNIQTSSNGGVYYYIEGYFAKP